MGPSVLFRIRNNVCCGNLSPLKSIALAGFVPAIFGPSTKYTNHYTTEATHGPAVLADCTRGNLIFTNVSYRLRPPARTQCGRCPQTELRAVMRSFKTGHCGLPQKYKQTKQENNIQKNHFHNDRQTIRHDWNRNYLQSESATSCLGTTNTWLFYIFSFILFDELGSSMHYMIHVKLCMTNFHLFRF
jgi:hypothetical protein